MSTSETGGEMNTEQSIGAGAAVSPATVSSAVIQNPRFSFIGEEAGVRRPVFDSPPAGGSTGASVGLSQNKKRGRPSKHGLDGSMSAAPPSAAPPTGFVSPQRPIPSAAAQPGAASATASKRPRGRPPGSKNKQKTVAYGSVGSRLTPHVIAVKTGEDIAEKIISFSARGPRTICVISATGKVATVALNKPATSGEITTHKGRFDIVSLSGSFMLCEIGGQRCWTGGLNLSLAADGLVLGGCVAGELTAASPVQVFVGSVTGEGKEDSKSSKPFEVPINANPDLVSGDNSQPTHGIPMAQANPDLVNGDNSQPSHGTPRESSRALGSTHQSEEPTDKL